MNKKQLIQIAVVIASFAGAGIVLYNGGVFGNSSSSMALPPTGIVIPGQPTTAGGQPIPTNQAILPFGDKLDFSAIDSLRFNYNQFEFGKLNVKKDVGIDNIENLIIPRDDSDNLTGASAPK